MLVGETGFESNLLLQHVCDSLLAEQDKHGQNPSYPLFPEDVSKVIDAAVPTNADTSPTEQNQSQLPIYVQQILLRKIEASPELAVIAAGWDKLPVHVRSSILLLVKTASSAL